MAKITVQNTEANPRLKVSNTVQLEFRQAFENNGRKPLLKN